MDFDDYSANYPLLIDLLGIASVVKPFTDSGTRKAVLSYMSNIVKTLEVPHDYIIAEIGKVMALTEYMYEEAI